MRKEHRRRSGAWRRVRALGAVSGVACLAIMALPSTGSAGAAGAKPTIADFVTSPKSLKTSSGAVSFSATLAHAKSCVLSATSTVPGLPLTSPCASKSFHEAIVLEENTGTVPLKITFTLRATGPGGNAVETTTVKIVPGAGQAWPTGFTGTYVGSDDTGDYPGGNLAFSGTINPDATCDPSVCTYEWTSMTGTWSAVQPPCSSFTADDSQGIGGSGNIEFDQSESPVELAGGFDFGVGSQPCGNVGSDFVSHVSGAPTFIPGTLQSVWPSDGGGTYTFNWIYP